MNLGFWLLILDVFHAAGATVSATGAAGNCNHKFWDEVVRKYGIADPDRSFIALNLAKSTFLQKLDVAFIPRYLIFEPNEKLIHPHASVPESEEFVRFFREVLSE